MMPLRLSKIRGCGTAPSAIISSSGRSLAPASHMTRSTTATAPVNHMVGLHPPSSGDNSEAPVILPRSCPALNATRSIPLTRPSSILPNHRPIPFVRLGSTKARDTPNKNIVTVNPRNPGINPRRAQNTAEKISAPAITLFTPKRSAIAPPISENNIIPRNHEPQIIPI